MTGPLPDRPRTPRRARSVATGLVTTAVALVASVPVVPVAARWLSPEVAVDAALKPHLGEIVVAAEEGWTSAFRDPWGGAWCALALDQRALAEHVAAQHEVFSVARRGKTAVPRVIYSRGPNGRDESGAGDDVFPTQVAPASWVLVAYAREILASLAGVCLFFGLCVLVPPRALAAEVTLVAAMAALPVVLVVAALAWIDDNLAVRDLLVDLPPTLLPPSVVAVGTVALVAVASAATLRRLVRLATPADA